MTPSVDWFKAQASAKTQLTDFGEPYYEDSVAAFCEDLNSGHLTEQGVALFTRQMINDLARRLQVLSYLAQYPEIEKVEIPTILYVSGLERTGTTFLHNVLSLDSKARALRRWELMYPVPAPERAGWQTDPRIAKVQSSIDRLRGTKLEHMHWVEATDPEECYWGLLNGFGILGGSAITIMLRFRDSRTQEATYQALREYRSVIKILLWKNPVPPGGHLVLKAPQFCGALSTLKRALPESRLIITHRDPHRALVSVCNLQAHIHEPFLVSDRLHDRNGPIADVVVRQTPARLRDIADYEDSGQAMANVDYPHLVADPVAVVERVYSKHGLHMPAVLATAIDEFTAAQKAGRRAKPAGHFADFGIDADALLGDPNVAAYCKRYRVRREGVRLTG